MRKLIRFFNRGRLPLIGLLFSATLVQADVIYDSGSLTFTPTGTQFGRIVRDGVPSDWSGPKSFPGVIGAPTARGYEVITVNSGPYSFLQINFDDPAVALFDAAYITAYLPVNSAPNYGLNVNYLGDPGFSELLGDATYFQIVVTPHTDILIPINEVNPGGGSGKHFSLLVEGFIDTEYNGVPEPSYRFLTVCGAVLLGALGWRRSVSRRNFSAN